MALDSPCLNSSCKSKGKFHPNCRCYGGMAEGGEVKNYCDSDQAHEADCEYYAEGGEVKTENPHHGREGLSNHLKQGLLKGHHEVSDAFLGHRDPTPLVAAAVANGGAPSLFKLGSNSIFEPRVAMKPKAMAERAEHLVSGFHGHKKDHHWNKRGHELRDSIPDMMAKPKEADLSAMAEGLTGRDIHHSAKAFISPVAMKLLAQGAGPDEMEHGVHYAEHVGKGMHKMDKAINGILSDKGMEHVLPDMRMRDKLKKFIGDGKLHDEIFADGTPHPEGKDSPVTEGADPIARHYPEQNTILQSIRGRVHNYLNSIKPQPTQPGLLMDPPQVSQAQKRTYDRALDIAVDPLSILTHIKKGTITPEQIGHINQMYPEVYQEISRKLTYKLMEDKAKGILVPYRTRQALSLFLGAPLDSTMTPASIQLIQSTFIPPAPPQGAAPNSKASLSKLPQGSQTSSQALEARQLRNK